MGLYLFRSALADFLRPSRIVVWVIVAAVVGGLAHLISNVMQVREPMLQYGQISAALAFKILALAAAIFGSNVVSQEIEQKTIVYMLTRPTPRWMIILCRALAAIVATFLVSLLTVVAVSIAVPDIGPFSKIVSKDLLAILVGSAAYCTLFIFVTLLVNKAMIVNLLFAFGWETAVPNMPGSTYYLSISSYILRIADHPSSEQMRSFLRFLAGQNQEQKISMMGAWLVMGCTIGVLALALTYWFSRFEYVPREDAE